MSKKFNVFKFVFAASLLLLTFVATFFALQNVNADSSITLEDGAKIRTTGKEGIKFIANVESLDGYTEVGFVCAKGTYDLESMKSAFDSANPDSWTKISESGAYANEKTSSNGITIIKSSKSVNSDEEGAKEITLTVYGIEAPDYLTDLSVFAYGKDANNDVTFSNISVSRNIAEVALQSSAYGKTSDLIDLITDYTQTNYKKVGYDLEGNFAIVGMDKLLQSDLDALKAEFIADANEICGTNLTTNCSRTEFAAAMKGTKTDTISDSNIYKTLRAESLNGKYDWILHYLMGLSGINANVKCQSYTALYDGSLTKAKENYSKAASLYNAVHLYDAIYCLFNKISDTYTHNSYGLNSTFETASTYNTMANYCTIYFDNVELVQIGNSIELPKYETPIGYKFVSWSDGNEDLDANDKYTVKTEDVKFTAVTEAIEYDIQLYNGNELYETITYTVEEEVELPKLNDQDGYAFGGWYDNPELSDEPITTIEKGSTEDKVYFAKWSLKVDTIIVDDDYSEMENGAKVEVEGESEEYIVGTNAFATIKEGLEVANENATIIVAAGNYADALSITKPVTIIGANKELVLAHDDTYSVSAESDSIISALVRIENGANDVTIKGFVATNQIVLYGNENVNISYLLFASPKATISGCAGAVNINAESNTVTLDHLYYNGKGEVSRLVYFYANITDFTISNSVIMNGASGLYDIIRGNDSSQIIGEFTVSKNYFQSVTQAAINIQQIGECECVVENNIFYKVYSGIYFRTENSNNITYTIQYNKFDSCGNASTSTYYPVRINSTNKSSIININYNIIKNSLGNYIIYIVNSTTNVDASNNYFNSNKTNNCLNATNSDKVAEESACGPRSIN